MKIKVERKEIIIFAVLILVSLIVYQGYVTNHYATDTYNIINKGYTEYSISNSFIDGRIIMGFLDIILDCINIPINIAIITFTLIGIIISCIAVVVLKNIILNLKKTEDRFMEILAILIAYITVFNFMYVENLYFIESIVMSISILMYILSIREILMKKRFFYLKALIFSIVATFSYQGTIGLFFIYGFVFTIINNKNDKKQIVKDLVTIISIILISYMTNIIQIKIVTNILNSEQARLGGINNIIASTKYVFKTFVPKVLCQIILNSCGLFPKGIMILFVISIIITIMINEIKNKKENLLNGMILIIIVAIIITTGMCIISLASYDTGRIHNVIGALIGIIYIYIFCSSDIFTRNEITKIILTMILIIYAGIMIFNTINLISQHKKVNNLEKEQCEGLEEYIKNYENENEISITEAKYFVKPDKNKSGYFKNISNKSVLTYNGIACTWSSIGAINFYTKRNFKDEKIDDIQLFERYTKLKEKGYNNNFIIIDGILYYTVFI